MKRTLRCGHYYYYGGRLPERDVMRIRVAVLASILSASALLAGHQISSGQYPISLTGVFIMAALLILDIEFKKSVYGQRSVWLLLVCAAAVLIGPFVAR